MRAVIYLIEDKNYVNIEADTIDRDGAWIIVKNKNTIVGMFDEGSVRCAYLTKKGV